jgi:hypothetical protein
MHAVFVIDILQLISALICNFKGFINEIVFAAFFIGIFGFVLCTN